MVRRRFVARALAVLVVAAGFLVPVTGPVTTVAPAAAADLSGFRPGNIISDELFFNGYWMSEARIQTFLEEQGASCAVGSDGTPCLKNYRMATTTQAPDDRCPGGYAGAPNELASTIIAKVAESCGINPQVILVTLQKEQSLVTTSGAAATASRYRIAMGYGCPDSAACDSKYYGFFNQVYRAAWQFRSYALSPTRFSYRAGITATIKYNPSSSCGSSQVVIENQATAGLYNYTPYQPDAAALAGGSDGCSSFGNLNFWRFWTDWFGPTYGWTVRDAVQALWTSTGGARGPMGVPVSAETCDAVGCTQRFSDALATWSAATGAQGLGGDILTLWNGLGGTNSYLGMPRTTALRCDGVAGCVQEFSGGTVTWSYATGARTMTGDIAALWHRLGGASAAIGYPTATVGACDGVAGCEQPFQRGSITWSWATGAQAMTGELLALWHRLGGAGSPLSYPTSTPPLQCDGSVGCAQTFSGGVATWSSATGAQAMYGQIATRWVALGGATDLGYPIESISPCQGAVGCLQRFQHGSMTWSDATGAQAMVGEFLRRWTELGGAAKVGYPTSTPTLRCDGAVGCQQVFQSAVMTWSQAAGVHVLFEDFGAQYKDIGGLPMVGVARVDGDPGACPTSGCTVRTAYSILVHTPSVGYQAVGGDIASLWERLGGLSSWLGAPTSTQLRCDGAVGCVAPFEHGTITWSARTGAQAMTTAVAARWSALGGLSSGVGLPLETPDQSCVATACAQRFENAVATWSMAQPAQMMSGEIAKLWLKSGGLDSGMGIALATLGPCDGTVGCVQLLTNGAITWSWRTGAQTVVGAFLEMWQGRGGIGSDLGLPTGSPPLRCDGFVGCVQDFSGGAATWSWAEGAQAIVGPIADRWQQLGGVSGLGIATASVAPCPTSGCVQTFQRGVIAWTAATGAQMVNGAFLDYWQGVGGATSVLGYPTSTPPLYCDGARGCSQTYQHGTLQWTAATGVRRIA